jgi:uncharacterized protein
MMQLSSKLKSLETILTDMQSVLVAYSGGTDSTFLLKVAANVLDEKVIAVTARSETYTAKELQEAKQNAEIIGATHMVVYTKELDDQNFTSNPTERCYYCKKALFTKLFELAKQYGLRYVIDGSNCDDEKDFRPGMKAAAEFRVRSPLMDAGFTKEEIRILSKEMHLPTWDKPSLPCLATRFPYGTQITREKIMQVASAEEYLAGFGIRQLRVRDHDNIARIEVSRMDMPMFLDEKTATQIMEKFKALGYTYVTLDLQGYRMGSMNEPLGETK